MKIELPEQVKICMRELERNGFEAYIVGGCVRDFLLKQEAKDIDIATNALPDEVADLMKRYKVVETGLKHGTLTVIIKGMPIEITTYRTYKENENTLAADLAKRDFTINALAYNEQSGLVDFSGGLADLEQKALRCVGRPEERFAEDGLRIMRGLRFAAVLGFTLEEQTRKAMFGQKQLLAGIAKERIASELSQLLCGAKAKEIILDYTEILGVIIPELPTTVGFEQNHPHHSYDVLTHTAEMLAHLPAVPHLRIAGLLHDIGKPCCYIRDANGIGHFYGHEAIGAEIAQKTLGGLKFDNFTLERVCTLVRYHDISPEADKKQVKRWLNKLSPEVFREILLLKKADFLAQNPEYYARLKRLQEIEEIVRLIIAEEACFSLKDLNVKGKDLLELGIPEGKLVGEILNRLLELVIDELIANDPAVLKDKALEIYRKQV